MPYGDMTGPSGRGPMTGRGMGKAAGNKSGVGVKSKAPDRYKKYLESKDKK